MISINRPAKDPNHRVLITGATDRYVFRSRIKNPPSVFFIVIHNGNTYMIRCIYVVKLKDTRICFVRGIQKLDNNRS